MPLHVSSTRAHRQEVKIVLYSLWYHHTCRWPSGAQVERGLSQSVWTVWTGGKSRPHRDLIPERPARSQSLYRLSYPVHSLDKHRFKTTRSDESSDCSSYFIPSSLAFRWNVVGGFANSQGSHKNRNKAIPRTLHNTLEGSRSFALKWCSWSWDVHVTCPSNYRNWTSLKVTLKLRKIKLND